MTDNELGRFNGKKSNELSDQDKIDRLIEEKSAAMKPAARAPVKAASPQSSAQNSAPKKIQFKPLHEGMGFHPFSDGLPYAPESKTKYASGSGAVSAGRPKFAAAPITTNQTSSKQTATVRQLQQRETLSADAQSNKLRAAQNHERMTAQLISAANTLNTHQMKSTAGVRTPTTAIGLNTTQTKAQPNAAKNLEVETPVLRRRVFAYLMDTVIHAGFWITTNLTALFLFKFQIDSEILRDHFEQFFLFFLISQWMFVALQEMLFENSIGKFFFNLEFKRNHSSLLLRSFIFMIGLLGFGLGLYYRPQDRFGQIQLKSKMYGNQPA